MFYLGLVTMKEMSPKQWAKAAGTQIAAGCMENSAADPVLSRRASRVSRGRALPSWSLEGPHGDFLHPRWLGDFRCGARLGASLLSLLS